MHLIILTVIEHKLRVLDRRVKPLARVEYVSKDRSLLVTMVSLLDLPARMDDGHSFTLFHRTCRKACPIEERRDKDGILSPANSARMYSS